MRSPGLPASAGVVKSVFHINTEVNSLKNPADKEIFQRFTPKTQTDTNRVAVLTPRQPNGATKPQSNENKVSESFFYSIKASFSNPLVLVLQTKSL